MMAASANTPASTPTPLTNSELGAYVRSLIPLTDQDDPAIERPLSAADFLQEILDAVSLPISLPVSLPDFPAEKPPAKTVPAMLGPMRPTSVKPGELWKSWGGSRLASTLLAADYRGELTRDEWRLVEYQDGYAVICHTWRTATMPAPAFYYYSADLKTWDSWDIPASGLDLYLRVDLCPDSGAISLPGAATEPEACSSPTPHMPLLWAALCGPWR
jgi:hypothetical protein